MNKKIIEAQRCRKAASPTGQAEAPRRDSGGGGGFQSPGGGFQRDYTQVTVQ